MTARVELASNADATSWEDITDLMYLEGSRWGGTADRGRIDTGSGFDLRDDAGVRTLPYRRRVRLIESATTPDTTMWQGRTVASELRRGAVPTGDAKQFDVSLVDVNGDFGGQGFAGSQRPAETDGERIRFLLDNYLTGQNRASTNLADTYFNELTWGLPAHLYEGQAIDWFTHITDTTGRQFFITRDYELFYDMVTSTAYAAGISITDDNPNFSTSFPPGEPQATEDATEMVSGARVRYSGHRAVNIRRPLVIAANDLWITGIADESITTAAAATDRANRYLDEFDHTQTTFQCWVDLPATQVHQLSWGMTISFRSAACGVLSPITYRVGRCSWELRSEGVWRAHLELNFPTKFGKRPGSGGSSPPPVPVTPFVPGDDGGGGDDIASFYENINDSGGAPGTVISDSFTILAGHPWKWTIELSSNAVTGGRLTIDCLTGGGGGGGSPTQLVNEGLANPGLSFTQTETNLTFNATGCVATLTSNAASSLTTHATDAGKIEYTDGSGLGTSSIPNVPVFGQEVIESTTGDGVTDDFQTNHPYVLNSLRVYVGGVRVIPTQTDPDTGAFSLPFVPANGTQIDMVYTAQSGEDTGAGNDDDPPSTTPTIPVALDLDDLGDVNAPSPSNNDVLTWDSTPGEWVAAAPGAGVVGSSVAVEFIIDGGGATITTGVKGYVEIPFAWSDITAVRMLADQSGSIVVDIWKDTYANYPPVNADSITASAPPTISSATKSEDTTLTGWTQTGSAGDILGFNVDSATTIQRVTVSLTLVRA